MYTEFRTINYKSFCEIQQIQLERGVATLIPVHDVLSELEFKNGNVFNFL